MLPVQKFQGVGKNEPEPECEYGELDLIINHKNVWANLQNADPLKIKYEIHDDCQWLPYVRDDLYPHRWDGDEELTQFKKWQMYVEREKSGGPIGSLDIDDTDPDWRAMRLAQVDYRIKGEYLQQFQPFYGPKERLGPLSKTEIAAKEKQLSDEIEAAIKQLRSVAHINQTNMNWARKMQTYIGSYINFMEDSLAGRFVGDEQAERKEALKEELRGLIPEGFQATLFPLSINFHDMEKVIALVKDKTGDFCTQFSNQQQFSVGVKIFPFDNRVVSLQILLIRVEKQNSNRSPDEMDDDVMAMMATQAGIEEEPLSGRKDGKSNKKGGDQLDNPQGGFDASGNIKLK